MSRDTPKNRCGRSLRTVVFAALACAALSGGCADESKVLELAAELAAEYTEAAVAEARAKARAESGAAGDSPFDILAGTAEYAESPASVEAEPHAPGTPRTYFQYTDDTGSVRFVATLEDVPAHLRASAGSVELTSAPPSSPADRRADFERRRLRARAVLAAAGPTRSRSDVQPLLYYAQWCGYCRKAKAHLDAAGVDYVLRDVDNPAIAAELRSKTGSGSIPVLDVDGELVRGYDPAGIDRLIAKL